MEVGIHIHEDDEGMRNLYPLGAAVEAASDIEAARRSAEKNLHPSGLGWIDLHGIEEPATTYVDAGLGLMDTVDALAAIMPRSRGYIATPMAGFSSDRVDQWDSYETDVWCFGFGPHCFIKLEPEGELVARIWYELTSERPDEIEAMRRAIECVDALSPSVIADYWLNATGPVGDRAFLDAYFGRLIETLKEADRRIEEMRDRS